MAGRLPWCILAIACAGGAQVHRDWKAHPAVVEMQTAAELYAVGDVHGDRERLRKLLEGAGILRADAWAAGNAILVFTGDLIDKGPDALGVIALLRTLAQQAARASGQVVVLLGNHEADFLAHPGAAKASEFAEELKHAGTRAAAVAACGGEVGEFLCGLPAAAKVNDWFFSHAGNTGGMTIRQLAAEIEHGVEKEGFGTRVLANPDSLLEARFGDKGPGGHSWIDAGGRGAPADRLLAGYAAALGVSHIVEGHHHGAVRFHDGAVRKAGEMFQWRGRLFLIDTGMSRAIDDSTGAVLHIGPRSAEAICADGGRTAIWEAKDPSRSGGAKPCRSRN